MGCAGAPSVSTVMEPRSSAWLGGDHAPQTMRGWPGLSPRWFRFVPPIEPDIEDARAVREGAARQEIDAGGGDRRGVFEGDAARGFGDRAAIDEGDGAPHLLRAHI